MAAGPVTAQYSVAVSALSCDLLHAMMPEPKGSIAHGSNARAFQAIFNEESSDLKKSAFPLAELQRRCSLLLDRRPF